jgi:hypothetical protein
MTQSITARARPAGGFVDNARALPTTPPTPQPQPGRTFSSSYKADIFTRCRQSCVGAMPSMSQMPMLK